MSHRVIWSLAFYAVIARTRRVLPQFPVFFRNRNNVKRMAIASSFVATNWLIYVWSVTHGHVMETSLGYFITPLLNVAIGAIVLSERLARLQWVSLSLASLGVAWLTVEFGRPPWIALALAATFAAYGYLKKVVPGDATVLSMVESTLLLPFAVAAAVTIRFIGPGASIELIATPATLTATEWALLVVGGAVTGLPLLLFGVAAQRLPLSTLGFFQYLAPTFQFLSAVFFFREPLPQSRLAGFAFIWAALAIFITHIFRTELKKTKPKPDRNRNRTATAAATETDKTGYRDI